MVTSMVLDLLAGGSLLPKHLGLIYSHLNPWSSSSLFLPQPKQTHWSFSYQMNETSLPSPRTHPLILFLPNEWDFTPISQNSPFLSFLNPSFSLFLSFIFFRFLYSLSIITICNPPFSALFSHLPAQPLHICKPPLPPSPSHSLCIPFPTKPINNT